MDYSAAIFILSLIVSVGTITFTALTMAFQRSHNIKCVKPLCNIHQCLTDAEAGISIQNAGLGPMMIKNIVLLGEPGEPVGHGVPLTQAVPAEFCSYLALHQTDVYALASLSEVKLLCCTSRDPDKSAISGIQEHLHSLTICVQYEDIYEHRYEKREALIF